MILPCIARSEVMSLQGATHSEEGDLGAQNSNERYSVVNNSDEERYFVASINDERRELGTATTRVILLPMAKSKVVSLHEAITRELCVKSNERERSRCIEQRREISVHRATRRKISVHRATKRDVCA